MVAESGQRKAESGISRDAEFTRRGGRRRRVVDSRLSRFADLRPLTSPLRLGITLMEVLISMFVLLFGLMGVAAIFPVGNYYVVEGEKFDQGSILAQNAFEELQARGMLKPEYWLYASQIPNAATTSGLEFIVPSGTTGTTAPGRFSASGPPLDPGYAFVIDPMSVANSSLLNFPDYHYYWPMYFAGRPTSPVPNPRPNVWNNADNANYPAAPNPQLDGTWPVRRMTLPIPDASGTYSFTRMTLPVAETIFRLRDDLAVELPERDDAPGIQRWDVDAAGNPLTRQYLGNFSWLATVVPQTQDARNGLQPAERKGQLYDVSVVVFYKRDALPSPESERLLRAELQPGGELVLYGDTVDEVDLGLKDIKAGDWIALMGVNQSSGMFMLKWYRLLALDEETRESSATETIQTPPAGTYYLRRAMLTGPDWHADPTAVGLTGNTVTHLRAAILPGVASVVTREMVLEGDSLWSVVAPPPPPSTPPIP